MSDASTEMPERGLRRFQRVVNEASTYFIGQQRVLVHDNTAREVTDLSVPGWELQRP